MSDIKSITPRKNKPGAGRKFGTGKFGEATSVVRIPASQKPVIKDFLAAYQRKRLSSDLDAVSDFELPKLNALPVSLPLYSSKVSAGFPSPAEDHIEARLDPSEFLIDQEDATYIVTIHGYSMIDVGLLPGDKAVIDRSLNACVGDIVVASVNGEFTIKTLGRHSKTNAPRLLPANASGTYSPIEITEEMQFEIWGVCTGSFRRFIRRFKR